jgi:hypothetical protein
VEEGFDTFGAFVENDEPTKTFKSLISYFPI